jgi:hypothetical protein
MAGTGAQSHCAPELASPRCETAGGAAAVVAAVGALPAPLAATAVNLDGQASTTVRPTYIVKLK